jgi:cystathionine beta-lyase
MKTVVDFDELIDRRTTESYKWREYPEDVLPLFVADMDFRSPEPVTHALNEYIRGGIFGYPRGLHSGDRAQTHELLQLVAERMADRYNWQITSEDIVGLPGVVPGLNIACRLFANTTGSSAPSVLVQTPVYPPILFAPPNAGMQCVEAPLHRETNNSYTIDWDTFGAAMARKPNLFILCNPNNPVGRVFRQDELARMAEICLSAKVTICADEIHSDLLFSGEKHVPIASLSPEVAHNTITFVSPSKTFNLAGLQCAFAIITNPELRKRFQNARAGLVPWVNAMGLSGAQAAYQHGQEWLDQLLPYLESNRDFLASFCKRELPGLRVTQPEGTYLAWIDCRETVSDLHEFFMKRARVALSDGRGFGTGGDGFVRLNFGCPRSILEEALKRMKAALR